MLPQAQDFLDESEALYAIVSPLSDEELGTKTSFKGWTIGNVIGHLHVWNWAADLTLKDGAAFQDFYKTVMKVARKTGSLTGFENSWLGDLKGQTLVKAWRENYLGMAERFGKADPSKRVKWAGPDMTVRSKITARLMETWAHAQEVYDQLGRVRANGDRVRNIVILGVNTYGWTFKNRKLEPPGPMPHLRLTAPSGEVWTYGEPSESECIEGLAEEFCQVVTQTRNIADTKLRVTGPVATDWMAKAQCFAGGPENPPPPGTRKMISKL
mmetsp:Transcript_39789/g.80389  ORF Transcript_39789/g.80389 Transcript_39789/m.80389 type:complete len:269 (+) Transcript_39789:41-847(+)